MMLNNSREPLFNQAFGARLPSIVRAGAPRLIEGGLGMRTMSWDAASISLERP